MYRWWVKRKYNFSQSIQFLGYTSFSFFFGSNISLSTFSNWIFDRFHVTFHLLQNLLYDWQGTRHFAVNIISAQSHQNQYEKRESMTEISHEWNHRTSRTEWAAKNNWAKSRARLQRYFFDIFFLSSSFSSRCVFLLDFLLCLRFCLDLSCYPHSWTRRFSLKWFTSFLLHTRPGSSWCVLRELATELFSRELFRLWFNGSIFRRALFCVYVNGGLFDVININTLQLWIVAIKEAETFCIFGSKVDFCFSNFHLSPSLISSLHTLQLKVIFLVEFPQA